MTVSLTWFHGERTVSAFTDAHLNELMGLIAQLSPNRRFANLRAFRSQFERVLGQSYVLVARLSKRLEEPGTIIGLAILVPAYKLTGFEGHVEDMVVHQDFRGQRLGRNLMEELLRYANEHLRMQTLHLTSKPDNPKRAAARALYAKLGFTERCGLFTMPLA